MEKYNQYKAMDFAEDPVFIQWVQSGFKEHDHIWSKVRDHSANTASEIKEAIDVVSIFHLKADAPANKVKEAALLSRIETTIVNVKPLTSTTSTKEGGIIRYLLPLAAAAIAALVFFILPANNLNTFATAADESKVEYTLPDNTTIILDASTSISYENGNSLLQDRKVKLNGQAFFKVQKGTPFIVETAYGKIEVLGTTFNVNSNNGLQVKCVTGKVKVSNSTSSTINTTGENSILKDGKIEKQQRLVHDLAWYLTRLDFNNKPLSSLVKAIEKEYQVTVQLAPGLDTLQYTGSFETDDLDKALRSITWPLNLTYEIKDETVFIK